MSKQPMIEQLIDAQLDFLDHEFAQAETVQHEFKQFYHWLRLQQLQHIWSFDQIRVPDATMGLCQKQPGPRSSRPPGVTTPG